MGPFQVSVFESVVAGVTLAALLGMWAWLRSFVKEQRRVNEANRAFIRSMQRAEIIRYFGITVEQGIPVSPEELTHIQACYDSYKSNGGNGAVKLMYERIMEHAKVVTKGE